MPNSLSARPQGYLAPLPRMVCSRLSSRYCILPAVLLGWPVFLRPFQPAGSAIRHLPPVCSPHRNAPALHKRPRRPLRHTGRSYPLHSTPHMLPHIEAPAPASPPRPAPTRSARVPPPAALREYGDPAHRVPEAGTADIGTPGRVTTGGTDKSLLTAAAGTAIIKLFHAERVF